MSKQKYIQIESKNAILEMLREGKAIERIYLAHGAFKDPKSKEIIDLARAKRIEVIKSPRKSLNRMTKGGSIESIVAHILPENNWTLQELLDKLYSQGITPFFLVLDHLKYDQNVGAVLRTAFASGVNGIITPLKRENFVTSEAIRVSMGAALRIPIVEANIFSTLKKIKDEGIKLIGVTMEGQEYYKADLRGAIAFVLGAEDVGISTRVLEKLDDKISIPMREGIGSLNVGASAAVVCYEKLRQEVSA